jgi:nitrite reductase/ring-hydroxylating ferredoxin subunit
MTAPDPAAPGPPAEGEMVAVEHEGSTVAVAMLEGELHGFDDTCTHAGCSLAEGELDGHTVVCPCHMATST